MAELLEHQGLSPVPARRPELDLLAHAAWECGSTRPGVAADPRELAGAAVDWLAATVPGTVAGVLQAAGEPLLDLDGRDWWFRANVSADGGPARLITDGIATLADLWINDEHILHSENMFRRRDREVLLLPGENAILIRCAALRPLLSKRRPRPRWKSYLVNDQNLRWLRTSLLGRVPGWAQTPSVVGPWRPVRLLPAASITPDDWTVSAWCDARDGVIDISLQRCLGVEGAIVRCGQATAQLQPRAGGTGVLTAQLRIPDAELWWPHTHGTPKLYEVEAIIDGELVTVANVGFRTIVVDRSNDGFALIVNGERIFCRGACWMPPDPVNLIGGSQVDTPPGLDAEAPPGSPIRQQLLLELAREAHMNMVRVPGTTVYPDRGFYELCDELGVLVWQDCMLAFLDPPEDEQFIAELKAELTQVFNGLSRHPSVALVCGNQEVQEIAAMNGLPSGSWESRVDELIPALMDELLLRTPYVESNPTGGSLPFQMNAGVSQYFGVGGYMRPLDDARRSGVRFAAECLALANPPEPLTVDEVCGGARAAGHDPRWKQAIHHDSGRSWDMDDVRDFYMRMIFGVDPLHERYVDAERALDLGRATNAEMMRTVFHEWRRHGSSCDGGLVLALSDLRAGAGWGLVDSLGRPKSSWYELRRSFQPVALLFTDEGLNGLSLHLVNDLSEPFQGHVKVELFAHGEVAVGDGLQPVVIPARGGITIEAAGLLDGFRDISYAYRFAPPSHDLVVATLIGADGSEVSQAVYLPLGQARSREAELGLTARACKAADGKTWELEISTRRFAQWVAVEAPGFLPQDSWFHLPPGYSRRVRLTPGRLLDPRLAGRPPHGSVRALNLGGPAIIELEDDAG